jgi:acetate kinase
MILVVNCGSSSLKYELFAFDAEQSIATGLAERVGVNGGGEASLKHRCHGSVLEKKLPLPDHAAALRVVLDALVACDCGAIRSLDEIRVVGHRVVHGGERFSESVVITAEVIAAIEQMCELAPLHNPANLIGIRACQEALPGVAQVAVFDTAFHQTMPIHAFLYGLPYALYEQHGIRRYGFHGTSHRYVSSVARDLLAARGLPPEQQRIVTCHLGNGCSMAAIKGGKCLDTTMGLTPLEGLLMGTRCGDLDPAIPLYLMDQLSMTNKQVDTIMNKESGLLGVSGVSNDMRDIQRTKAENPRSQAALDVFCYRVRKYVGAYAAAMGGLDAVVFTAGIGENDLPLVAQAMAGLEFLGLTMDPAKTAPPEPSAKGWDLATDDSPGRVFIIPTDEELTIARDAKALLLAPQ